MSIKLHNKKNFNLLWTLYQGFILIRMVMVGCCEHGKIYRFQELHRNLFFHKILLL